MTGLPPEPLRVKKVPDSEQYKIKLEQLKTASLPTEMLLFKHLILQTDILIKILEKLE
jgi:hypothetical protein